MLFRLQIKEIILFPQCICVLTVALAVSHARQGGRTTLQSGNEQRSRISPREEETEDIEYQQEEQDGTSQKRKEYGRLQHGYQESDGDNQQKSSAGYNNKQKYSLDTKQNNNYGRQRPQATYGHQTTPHYGQDRVEQGTKPSTGGVGWDYGASGTERWPWCGHAGWGWRFKGGAGARYGVQD